MGKVISIANQKGGVGKTTVSILVAGIINEICKNNQMTLAVIDADFQQSFYKTRQTEYENLEDELKSKPLYPVFGLEHITKNSIIQDTTLNNIIQKYDIIMIDVPGTLDFENSTKVYKVLDYIFAPLYKDDITIESAIEFFQVCEEMKNSKNYKLKEYYWFYNQYFQKSFATYSQATEVMEELFPNTKKLENNLMRSEEFITEKSTIEFFRKKQYHKPSTNLYNFTIELINLVLKIDKNQ